MTFLAALRHDRIDAPCLFDGPINGESFQPMSSSSSPPRLNPATSSSWTISAATGATPSAAIRRPAPAVLPAALQPDLNPIEQVFAKLKHLMRKAAERTLEAVGAASELLNNSPTRMRQLSASDTLGNFFTNATMVQISWSGTLTIPKLGMPVMLMPFLITQNSCSGVRSLATLLEVGRIGLQAFGEFGPIDARRAVAMHAAALGVGARARLHHGGIIERHRRLVDRVALDRSLAHLDEQPI